jgi:hypothetical protein
MPSTKRSKYLEIIKDTLFKRPHAKTEIFIVRNKQAGLTIGLIKWATNFRKYAFYPFNNTYYDPNCLEDIADFCRTETIRHKTRAK